MIILGIDVSMLSTGWCLINNDRIVKYGAIKNTQEKYNLTNLENIYSSLDKIPICHSVDKGKYNIDAVGIESYYVRPGHGACAVSEARGIVKLWISQNDYKYYEFTPQTIKQSATGSGKADKKAVHKYISKIFPILFNEKCDDITDAAAIAIITLLYHKRDKLIKKSL